MLNFITLYQAEICVYIFVNISFIRHYNIFLSWRFLMCFLFNSLYTDMLIDKSGNDSSQLLIILWLKSITWLRMFVCSYFMCTNVAFSGTIYKFYRCFEVISDFHLDHCLLLLHKMVSPRLSLVYCNYMMMGLGTITRLTNQALLSCALSSWWGHI